MIATEHQSLHWYILTGGATTIPDLIDELNTLLACKATWPPTAEQLPDQLAALERAGLVRLWRVGDVDWVEAVFRGEPQPVARVEQGQLF